MCIALWHRNDCTFRFFFFFISPKSNGGRVQVRVGTHQALALLAVLHPRVPAAVGQQAVLV